VERKKLVNAKARTALDVYREDCSDFSGHRNALASASGSVLLKPVLVAPAPHGANVDDAFLSLRVCFVRDH
jgi:hypothetical protein